jgi:hypothetical protein
MTLEKLNQVIVAIAPDVFVWRMRYNNLDECDWSAASLEKHDVRLARTKGVFKTDRPHLFQQIAFMEVVAMCAFPPHVNLPLNVKRGLDSVAKQHFADMVDDCLRLASSRAIMREVLPNLWPPPSD